jgi:ubiquinone/menaquinone biosynthesis C-methylase UbiE
MVTNKEIYEQTLPDGKIFGEIGVRDIRRFEDTTKYVYSRVASLLDVGCCTGDWLNHITQNFDIKEHVGVDVAANRIAEAKRRYPDLNLKVGFAEELKFAQHSFDVVTCCEVLEHVPDWMKVFQSLFYFADKQVLITVPYCEEILHTVCIHCGESTPMYGHLRSYVEDTFPAVEGWSVRFSRIRDRSPLGTMARKVYRYLRPHYPWLLVDYRRD